jgi:hypothetical protein
LHIWAVNEDNKEEVCVYSPICICSHGGPPV